MVPWTRDTANGAREFSSEGGPEIANNMESKPGGIQLAQRAKHCITRGIEFKVRREKNTFHVFGEIEKLQINSHLFGI